MTRLLVLLMVLLLAACGTTTLGATVGDVVVTSSTVAGPLMAPDPTLTTGAIDPTLTAEYLCSHPTRERRKATAADKAAVYAAYRITSADKHLFVLDDLVPLELGGVNSRGNLWPQPVAQAHTKDVVENQLHRDVCAGRMALVDAQGQMLAYGR